MVVYEVDIEVAPEAVAAYRPWLSGHVQRMLALPGFVDAEVLTVREPLPADGWHALCVRYRLRDRAALDAYLHGHAARMRAEGAAAFGERFRARRRVLDASPD
ncbi:DUF4286 family protein [Luteimonas sp. SJ-92]|uniref:DUF4286 family protein n=1 Tax=Luteimonas salinisoli TaxID=2752307 RepID=A0A853JAN5_9GAMM|nr:DUF4286 family protein [Luteimonas salinisoli]NZA25794.1 DUF4286 family protein [Luteimonas salinisoli]